MICGGCISSPKTIVEVRPAPPEVQPANLVKPCPGKYAGPLARTEDFITRGDVAERALAVCSAQVAANAKWREGVLQSAGAAVTD